MCNFVDHLVDFWLICCVFSKKQGQHLYKTCYLLSLYTSILFTYIKTYILNIKFRIQYHSWIKHNLVNVTDTNPRHNRKIQGQHLYKTCYFLSLYLSNLFTYIKSYILNITARIKCHLWIEYNLVNVPIHTNPRPQHTTTTNQPKIDQMVDEIAHDDFR